MTSVSQLRKEFCVSCDEITVHNPSGCVRNCGAVKAVVVATPERVDRLSVLAPREKQIFYLLAKLHTIVEIAALLSISAMTVRNTRHQVCSKLRIELTRDSQLFSEWARTNKVFVRGDAE